MKTNNFYFLFLIFTLSVSSMGFAQKKGYFTGAIDLVAPHYKSYFFNDDAKVIYTQDILEDGFLLNSFGIKAGYYYPIFKKLSVGGWTGFQTDTQQKFAAIKLGGEIRFYVYDMDNLYIYLHDGNNFTLDKSKYKSGNNMRFGMGLPIIKNEEYNIILDFFWEQNHFNMEGANKLIGYPSEIPRVLTVHSYGISFGIRLK
jgi:hypothetical protein